MDNQSRAKYFYRSTHVEADGPCIEGGLVGRDKVNDLVVLLEEVKKTQLRSWLPLLISKRAARHVAAVILSKNLLFPPHLAHDDGEAEEGVLPAEQRAHAR